MLVKVLRGTTVGMVVPPCDDSVEMLLSFGCCCFEMSTIDSGVSSSTVAVPEMAVFFVDLLFLVFF